MPPSKSPAKKRAPTPEPVRNSSRTGKSPSRLGQNDNWGSTTPTKWVSEIPAQQKAKEEELYKERLDFVSKLNAETDKKGTKSMFETYKTFMAAYSWSATIAQTVILTVLGYAVGQTIKAEAITPVEASQWGGWGLITAVTSLPYLMWLSKTSFAKKAQVDAVLKALFNQAVFSQLLNALFLSYWALLKGEDPVAAITAGMLSQAMMCASFWLPSDLINMYLIPVEAQMLWNASLGVAWSALLAYYY